MFTKDELKYLLEAVQCMVITNTGEGRNKAGMMTKICNLLDTPDVPVEVPASSEQGE